MTMCVPQRRVHTGNFYSPFVKKKSPSENFKWNSKAMTSAFGFCFVLFCYTDPGIFKELYTNHKSFVENGTLLKNKGL